MSDDDRARRRMGDATKGRIADLASGWEVPPEAKGSVASEPEPVKPPASGTPGPAPGPPVTAVSGEVPRKKPRTQPPPPPGSPLRTKPPTEPPSITTAAAVTAPPAVPLPLPPPPSSGPVAAAPAPDRSKPATRPPPLPTPRARSEAKPEPIGDEGELTTPDLPPKLAPPPTVGDSGFAAEQKAVVKPDPSKGLMKRILDATPIPGPPMRPSSPGFDIPQATVKEDMPLGLRAEASAVVEGPRGMRGDPTLVPTGDDDASRPNWRGDPSQISTSPFERGDPTGKEAAGERDDQTVASVGSPAGMTALINLRPEASLPRKRGILGDVRYVFTVTFGVAKARREAVAVGQVIGKQLAERKERLVALGRAAVVSERFDHPALTAAREALGTIEEERSRHAGALEAADGELEHVKRERTKRAKQVLADIAAQEAELVSIGQKLEPLERESLGVRRRAGDLADQLKKLDARIRATEASLSSIKTKREDRAAVHAEIATLKADREAVQQDEPAMAAQLDSLAPRMASLEAARTDATAKIAELREEEIKDQRRAEELIAAIEAKRKVVERSHSDAEAARDKALHGLAERLLIDRPSQLGRAFEPIDELDLKIATGERRAMELRELLGSVDRRAMARGIAVMVVIAGGAIAGVVLALTA